MKKHLSGLMALLLLLTVCAGCGNNNDDSKNDSNSNGASDDKGIYYDITGIEPQESVLEYDGNSIPAEMYFYWLGYSCSGLEYNINMYNAYYGLYGEVMNEDGSIIWDAALDDTTPNQMALDDAESNCLSYMVLENMAKEYNVTLTDEDKADMADTLAQQIEQAGGEDIFQNSLKEMGISRETFDRIASAGYLADHLQELAADPSSSLYEAPDLEKNAYVDHILLMTMDADTREPLSDEDAEAKRVLAEDLLSQLQAAGDVEALFNQLVEEYGEDQGRNTDAGYLVDPETNFVPEFLDAAFALKPGEISGIVESSYGYHILLRKEVTDDQMVTLAGDHLMDILSERMEAAMNEMTRSDKLDGITAGKFYTDYMAKMQEMQAANAPEDGSDGASE